MSAGRVRCFFTLIILVFSVSYAWYWSSERGFSNKDVYEFWQNVHRDLGKSQVWNTDESLGMDSRLWPALWLNFLNFSLEKNEKTLSIPFSWNNLIGENSGSWNVSEGLLSSVCSEDYCDNFNAIDDSLSPQVRKSLGQYNLARAQIPRSVLFMGLKQEDDTEKALQLDLRAEEGPSLAEIYCQESLSCQIELSAVLSTIRGHWSRLEAQENLTSGLRIFEFPTSHAPEFSSQDFKPEETNLCESFSAKYFHEANLIGTSVGSHFDWRFFRRADYSELELKTTLHRLARAWLRFCKVAGLKAWLAHGSLLGWYWNGLSMPWDNDLDVQMSLKSLNLLAKVFNQTIVVDCTDDPNIAGAHQYFIDVSPHLTHRRPDSQNVIDARFIDIETGMYVDITALSRTDPELVLNSTNLATELHAVFDSEYTLVTKSASPASPMMKQYFADIKEAELKSSETGHLVNCKSPHFYKLDEIGPFIATHFEGVAALVPSQFEILLKREYPKGLRLRHYNDWIFRPFLSLWVHQSVCSSDHYGDKCLDRDIALEKRFTQGIRLSRGKRFAEVKDNPRVDPYMVRRNALLNAGQA